MADLNEAGRKLTVKIVYYGPALSGKTTNLIQLHDEIHPSSRSEMMSLETKGDRTLFFDLLPLGIQTESRYTLVFKLFTVPGQVAHDATRKSVLSRADGVVFVADSAVNQAINNMESFENLEKNIRRLGMDMATLPLVIQFNKRDLEGIESEDAIRSLWGPTGIPVIFATALYGKGVARTFREILKRSYRHLDSCHDLDLKYKIGEKDFLSVFGPVS